MDSPFLNIRYQYVEDPSLFPFYLSNEAMTSNRMQEVAGGGFKKQNVLIQFRNIARGYWHLEDLKQARQTILAYQMQNNTFNKNAQIVREYSEKITEVLDQYQKEYSELIGFDKKMCCYQIFVQVCDMYRELCVYAYSANLLDRMLVDDINKSLKEELKNYTEDDINSFFLTLTRNPLANYVYNHDLALIDLLLHKDDHFDENLATHMKKWRGLFLGAGASIHGTDEERNENIQSRIEQFNHLSVEELKTKQEEIKSVYKQSEDDITSLLSKLQLSADLVKKITLLRDSIYLKETRKFALTTFQEEIRPLIKNLAELTGLKENSITFLLKEDLKELLFKDPQRYTDESIQEMKKKNMLVVENGKTTRFVGAEFDQKVREFKLEDELYQDKKEDQDNKLPEDKKEFKGIVPCKGYYEGPVKIVLSPKDFNKVNSGDILVTSITTPEYVVLFDLLKGMITYDGGGLTSHPATLAREYKIPAVLGIKDLDGVLHDGDRVVIDANNGLVKVL